MMYNWREKVLAPGAIVAVHQTGIAIDRMRSPVPAEAWKQVGVYTTYVPAVGLAAWNMFARSMPLFMEEMVAPAMTLGLDDLTSRLVNWATAQSGGTSSAVTEAQRIIAEARARGKGAGVSQSIARDEKLLA